MAERRKDNKGRVLRKGESQRKDLLYQYRYTDITGKRQTVYANNLTDLRDKEHKIEVRRKEGVDFAAGGITVLELATRYIELKQNIKVQTLCGYRTTITALKNSKLGHMHICDVKQSDVKFWYIELRKSGKAYSTIAGHKSVLKPAFKMAYDEYAISRNPFDFPIKDVIKNDSQKRLALTKEQQVMWLEFIRNDRCFKKHYDEFVVLLETGLRISELCGLTFKDLDFEKRRIRVERQLLRRSNGSLAIGQPKSNDGIRMVPMTDAAYDSFKRILANRRKVKVEPVVDGVSGFVFINQRGRPMTNALFESTTKCAREKFARAFPDADFPKITPHVFRHTFCTNMANAGMDPKALQYIMGHSTVSITLDIYTHTSYDQAVSQMEKLAIRSPEAE